MNPALRATYSNAYMNVLPGSSLADTAAQRGVVGLKTFRALGKLLFEKFRLRIRLLPYTLPASGTGGSGEALGTVQ